MFVKGTWPISGITSDCRWFLLLLLSLLVSLHACGDAGEHWVLLTNVTQDATITWREMELHWDSSGPDGVGVYGDEPNLAHRPVYKLGNGAEYYRFVSPRLAVFIYQPFDLNQVDVDTLQVIRGIGPKLAAAIVDFRLAHGTLHAADELVAVKGIGPVKIISLRNNLVIYPARP